MTPDPSIDEGSRGVVAAEPETSGQLSARAATTVMVRIEPCDRREFARALVLQGYDAPRAHRMAYDTSGEIKDNDGALQMLGRHRLNATKDLIEALHRLLNWGGRFGRGQRAEDVAFAQAVLAKARGEPQ